MGLSTLKLGLKREYHFLKCKVGFKMGFKTHGKNATLGHRIGSLDGLSMTSVANERTIGVGLLSEEDWVTIRA